VRRHDSGGERDLNGTGRLSGFAPDDLFACPIDRARDLAQRELTQGREVLVGEEVRECGLDLLGA
jgi:hypothetical protein